MTYVLSDIHGNERRFRSVMEQIRLQPEDTLYILGDVVDRHPGGIRILRQIMAMPNAKMLLGNHEYMMLRALGSPYDDYADTGNAVEHWYRNGGKVTHDHWKRIRKSTRREIVAYLHSLPLNIDVTVKGIHYKLVHGSTPEAFDGEAKYKNKTHFAVWKRLELTDPAPQDGVWIFGHTPTMYYQERTPLEVWWGENRIGIDCGSGFPDPPEKISDRRGRLACLRLEDGKRFYSTEQYS